MSEYVPLRDFPGYFLRDGEVWSAWTRGCSARIAERPLRKLVILPRGLVRLYRDRVRYDVGLKRLIREQENYGGKTTSQR